jgi:riboflavin biosynthesis pyrimidine reductase
MFKRLLSRLFGRNPKPAVVVLACKPADLLPKFPQICGRANRQPRTIVVSTPSGRDDQFSHRFIEGRDAPIWVYATTLGDTCKREVLAGVEPVSSHHHHHHDTGSYDSGSSDSGSSSSCD